MVGYGSSGRGRADVLARVPGVTNFFVGWAAYGRVLGALTVAGQRLDGTLCRIGSIRRRDRPNHWKSRGNLC